MTDSGVPPRLEAVYRVRFDEATPEGAVRPGAMLGFLQDVAWLHSSALGFTRAWYAERSLAWLVRAIELELREPIRDGDEVRLSTQVGGYRKVLARRVSELRAADGRQVGHALVDWAMTDGRGPVRVPPEFLAVPGVERGSFSPLRVDLGAPTGGSATLVIVPRRREIDPMGHANNGAYADWLDEAVVAAGGLGLVTGVPRRYTIEYLRPATPGAALRSTAWPSGAGFAWRLADAATGDDLAHGRLERA